MTIADSVTNIGTGTFTGSGLNTVYMSTTNGLGLTDGTGKSLSGKTGITMVYTDSVVITKTDSTEVTVYTGVATSLDATVYTGESISAAEIKSVVINSRFITTLSNDCFEGCTGMEAITLPSSITTIGDEVFKDCTNANFTEIIIPDNVTSIGNNVFDGCSSLVTVYMSSNNGLNLTASAVTQVSGSGDVALSYGLVTISGTPTEDQTLTAVTSGISYEDGSFSYQWKRGGSDISGETNSTYVLTQTDVGTAITVTFSYTDEASLEESITSAATSSVANVNDAPTVANAISDFTVSERCKSLNN